MKMTKEDQAKMNKWLDVWVNDNWGTIKLIKQGIKADPRVKDPEMRLRWDILHYSRIKIGDGVGVMGDINLYAYLDSSHIDTYLKTYVKRRSISMQEVA